MKKFITLSTILVSVVLAGLAGCSSSDDPPSSNVTGIITDPAQLVGAWLNACEIHEPGTSTRYSVALTVDPDNANIRLNSYHDETCGELATIERESFSYTIGADFALDGTVAGITTGTAFNTTDTMPGSPDIETISYESLAIVGNLLYAGDAHTNPDMDASTPAKRPTKLVDNPFVKQSIAEVSGAVTSTALVTGVWQDTCEIKPEGDSSTRMTVTLTDTDAGIIIKSFSDENCATQFNEEHQSFSYSLGTDFALDGSVAGITTGTALDTTDTMPGSPGFNTTRYESLAIVGNLLYVGDAHSIDPDMDASTPEKHPTKLVDNPFIKQPAG